MFTVCGKPVVLKVESLKLMQMGNVLHCYLLDFVVLASGDQTQTVNGTADESFTKLENVDVYYC